MVDEQGKFARSIMRPISVSDTASLLEVKLLTGRTHQVRVHAQSEGHPVAGDPKYGDPEFNKTMKSFGVSRLFLHAASLRFRHPVTDVELQVVAPLSDDLKAVLTKLTLSSD